MRFKPTCFIVGCLSYKNPALVICLTKWRSSFAALIALTISTAPGVTPSYTQAT